MDEDVIGKIPPSRKSRSSLVKTHKAHVESQDNDQTGPRPVKQPIILEAYNASAKSIRDLELASQPPLRQDGSDSNMPS